MSTVNPTFSLPFFRDIEVCQYSETCRYAKVCEYAGDSRQSANTLWQLQAAALSAGQSLLGAAMLVGGVALSLTLFLIPLGLPLALLGVAFLNTSSEAANRRA